MFKPQDKGPRMHCFSCIVWCSHRNKKEEAQVSNYHLWAEETLFLSVFTFFWGLFSSPTPFAATGQQPTCSWFPFSAEQFLFLNYGFICGWPRPVSSRSAKQPGWRSPPIVTIATIVLITTTVSSWHKLRKWSTLVLKLQPQKGKIMGIVRNASSATFFHTIHTILTSKM